MGAAFCFLNLWALQCRGSGGVSLCGVVTGHAEHLTSDPTQCKSLILAISELCFWHRMTTLDEIGFQNLPCILCLIKKRYYKHIFFWPGILNFNVEWPLLRRAGGKSLGNISASRQFSSSWWVTIHTTRKGICQKEQISLLFPGWDTKDPPYSHTHAHTHTHTHTHTYPLRCRVCVNY